MAKQGDAYPDPRKMRSGRFTKALICIGLVLVCLGSTIAMVAAPGPDPFPDPCSVPGPITRGYPADNLPEGDSVLGNQPIFI